MIKNRLTLLAGIVLCVVKIGNAQLSIDTTLSAEEMVKTIFAAKDNDSKIENVKYKGYKKSLGIFNCSMIE